MNPLTIRLEIDDFRWIPLIGLPAFTETQATCFNFPKHTINNNINIWIIYIYANLQLHQFMSEWVSSETTGNDSFYFLPPLSQYFQSAKNESGSGNNRLWLCAFLLFKNSMKAKSLFLKAGEEGHEIWMNRERGSRRCQMRHFWLLCFCFPLILGTKKEEK